MNKFDALAYLITKRETPEEYAQRRANETGRAYIVSNMGHALADTPDSRRHIREIGCTVASRFKPEKTSNLPLERLRRPDVR